MGIIGGPKSKRMKKKKKVKVVQKTRKELRKEKRKQKKIHRAEYNQKKNKEPGKYVLNPDQAAVNTELAQKKNKQVTQDEKRKKEVADKKKQEKLQREKEKRRNIQLREANVQEDKMIKQLEKQLKLNKRKSKTIPKSFAVDGLDYLLEVCDEDNRKLAVETEKQLAAVESGSEFEEDFLVATGSKKSTKIREDPDESEDLSSNDSDHLLDETDEEETEEEHSSPRSKSSKKKNLLENKSTNKRKLNAQSTSSNDEDSRTNSDLKDGKYSKKKKKGDEMKNAIGDERRIDTDSDSNSSSFGDQKFEDKDGYGEDISDDEDQMVPDEDSNVNEIEDEKGLWEDIYGRKRDKEGHVLTGVDKYVPPAARVERELDSVEDEKLNRLKKQLKGLLNRLAEYNMHNISSQIDELYMSNSRNSMNQVLMKLLMEALVSPVLTPDRLITEHMLLITILHANVGTEIGAHFLLTLVKKFDEMLKRGQEVENKELDNVVLMISHLYNFKVYDSQLLYQILERLAEKFTEKEVELILLILRTVGFVLRKDNPLALKELIFNLQHKATNAGQQTTRVKFMLEILLAIKNNNMTKIPQYDPSHVEHLKKMMKSLVRKGNYVTQLNVTLDDLLKADERGKWWIVGSAWTGNVDAEKPLRNSENSDKKPLFSEKLQELAHKQRMNTDIRRNIFCVLMTAEDYLDAFEKLHRLGLKNQQEREVIYVIIDCCLQEKKFNPYYAVLAQKFCDYDRKYQMTIQYTLWDKLKMLQSYTQTQLTNLARFLTHLFVERGLPLSVLKVVQFGELDKHTVRLVRQIMLGILLQDNSETCVKVFERISLSPQLQTFREGLRLFLHHFLLKNAKTGAIPEAEMTKLKERVESVEKALTTRGSRMVF